MSDFSPSLSVFAPQAPAPTAVLELPDALDAALAGDAIEHDYVLATTGDTPLTAPGDATPPTAAATPARGRSKNVLAEVTYALIAAPSDARAQQRFTATAMRYLHAFFLRRGAGDESETLAANTLWRVMRAVPKLQPVGAVAFIWTTATNLLRNHYRDHARAQRLFAPAVEDMPDGEVRSHLDTYDSGDDLARTLEFGELRTQIATVVAQLPAPQRDVLMAAYAGYTLQDMAARLQIPEGTVKSRLHRARAAALARMRPYLDEGRVAQAH